MSYELTAKFYFRFLIKKPPNDNSKSIAGSGDKTLNDRLGILSRIMK
jgi:hypothetical protein